MPLTLSDIAQTKADERLHARLDSATATISDLQLQMRSKEAELQECVKREQVTNFRLAVHAKSRVRAAALQAEQLLIKDRKQAKDLADIMVEHALESAEAASHAEKLAVAVNDREARLRFLWWKDDVRQHQHDDLMRKRYFMLESIYTATVKVSSSVMGMTTNTDAALTRAGDRLSRLAAKVVAWA